MLDLCQECWNAINGLDDDVYNVLGALDGVIVTSLRDDGWDVFYCDTCHKNQYSPMYHGDYLEMEIR